MDAAAPSAPDRQRLKPAVATALIVVAFVAALPAHPLYFDNQNTKFLQGLADAFPDRLGGDWTAQTVDGLPVFSALVRIVAQVAPPAAYHVLGALLAAIMALALLAFARRSAGTSIPTVFVVALSGLIFVIAAVDGKSGALGGVASQYMTNGYLQPSEFGILYLPALLLAADGRRGALLLSALPAAIHPAYIILSALICAAIIWHDLREDGRRFRPLETVLALLVIALPPLDLSIRFAPTDAETFARANEMLAFQRIPHHSDPAEWLDGGVFTKLAVAVLAMVLLPRGVLRTVLGLLLLWAVAGTAYVALTGNAELALVAPWRVSILIVPLSVALVAGALARWVYLKLREGRALRTIPAVALGAACLVGAFRLAEDLSTFAADAPPDHIVHIRETAQPTDVYLTSVGARTFRLDAMVPQYVTWKSHPYLDTEVVEWGRRVDLARAVFGEGPGRREPVFDCGALEQLLMQDEVTHVVVGNEPARLETAMSCPFIEPDFRGTSQTVFSVLPAARAR